MKKSNYRVTTFQITEEQYTQLRMMCVLTNKRMGEFIRIAINDKIKELKGKKNG